MNQGNAERKPDRVKQAILNTIVEVFGEPEFDNDLGVVRFLDHDERCVRLGLFTTNDDGEITATAPAEVFTIAVSRVQGESK